MDFILQKREKKRNNIYIYIYIEREREKEMLMIDYGRNGAATAIIIVCTS